MASVRYVLGGSFAHQLPCLVCNALFVVAPRAPIAALSIEGALVGALCAPCVVAGPRAACEQWEERMACLRKALDLLGRWREAISTQQQWNMDNPPSASCDRGH